MSADSWEDRMARRAAERRRSQPEPDDPHSGHIQYWVANSHHCSCGAFLGVNTIALTGDIAESCHVAAQDSFFEFLRTNGFQALNGALAEAVETVLRIAAEEHPGFDPDALTAHTRAVLAED